MTGLSRKEVRQRIKLGQTNAKESPNTRTYREIIRKNTLTFFNFLNLVLFTLLLAVGSVKNAMFMVAALINTGMGTIQEIRAKRIIDRLAILTSSKSMVIREGKRYLVPSEKIVLGDIVRVKAGEQVPADLCILYGSVEVNEALLTGESDTIYKKVSDELLSGSVVMAGEAYAEAIRVGKDNYAAKITREAKEYRKYHSELRSAIDAILKIVGIAILPMGILLLYKSYWLSAMPLKESVVSMVAAVVGMIPSGLVLLTSVALTVGAMILAGKNVLIQEPYCMETLSRVDVLCLDKTGTITTGQMRVEKALPYTLTKEDVFSEEDIWRMLLGERVFLLLGEEEWFDYTPYARNMDEYTLAASCTRARDIEEIIEKSRTSKLELVDRVIIADLPPQIYMVPALEEISFTSEAQGEHPAVGEFSLLPLSEIFLETGKRKIDAEGKIPEEKLLFTENGIYETFTEGEFREEAYGLTEKAEDDQNPYQDSKIREIGEILGNLMRVLKEDNPTAMALRERYYPREGMKESFVIPFSSERKYSGAVFAGRGTFLIGALQFLFPKKYPALARLCASYAAEGFRVLILAYSPSEDQKVGIPEDLVPIAIIQVSDILREQAERTFSYFSEQGVDVKVISGDDPLTVAAIARKAGLHGAENCVDLSQTESGQQLEEAASFYTVFGRVSPQQKKELIKAFQKQGHTVAMTGDGVNDVLALKEADCSIAMAAGSEAAKNISNVVLMDSDFSALPHVVNQGRRVLNNIRQAASMFLIKTIFSILLALITIFWGDSYPFEPIQMTLIGACAVGIPTFLLSQEPNYQKGDQGFLRYVFLNAVPAAVTITGCVVVIMAVCEKYYPDPMMCATACVLVTGWNYMAALRAVYEPLNTYRTVVIYGMQFIFFGAAILFQHLLSLEGMEFGLIILVFLLMTVSPLVIRVITGWLRRQYQKAMDGSAGSPLRRFADLLMGQRL